MTVPRWMEKYPCFACGSGHGKCAQGWKFSLMCCKDCEHESRREYTAEDYREMWEGLDMPENVRKMIEGMERK